VEALHEQGVPLEEVADLLPALGRLSEWQAPLPSPEDTRRLLSTLTEALPKTSAVRLAIATNQERQGSGLRWLLATARTQVSLFGTAFWLVSALVTLLGGIVVLGFSQEQRGPDVASEMLLLQASGPFLAYLGTAVAFRGAASRVLELELVCLPSPLQLALARLVVILGYDVGLGLALSLLLWVTGTGQVLALVLSWFMPLLLVAGLALVLSLRFPPQVAAALAYGSWLAVLAAQATLPLRLVPVTPLANILLGGLGLVLLGIALHRMRLDLYRSLPMS
jgi:hypothetical protein